MRNSLWGSSRRWLSSWRQLASEREARAQQRLQEDNVEGAGEDLREALRLHMQHEGDSPEALSLVDRLIAVHLTAALQAPREEQRREQLLTVDQLYQGAEKLLATDVPRLARLLLRKARQLEHFDGFKTATIEALRRSIQLCLDHQLEGSGLANARLALAGNLRDGPEHAEEVEHLYRSVMSEAEDPQMRLHAQMSLGTFFLAASKFKEAVEILESGLPEMRKYHAESSPWMIRANSLRLHAMMMLGQLKEAAEMAIEVVRVANSIDQVEPEVGDSLLICALALDAHGDSKTAIAVLERAKDVAGCSNDSDSEFDQVMDAIKERERNSKGLGKILTQMD